MSLMCFFFTRTAWSATNAHLNSLIGLSANKFSGYLLVNLIPNTTIPTTGFIAEYLPSPLMILIVWLLCGFFAICGALLFSGPLRD